MYCATDFCSKPFRFLSSWNVLWSHRIFMAGDNDENDRTDEFEKTIVNSGFQESNTAVEKGESKDCGTPCEGPADCNCATKKQKGETTIEKYKIC